MNRRIMGRTKRERFSMSIAKVIIAVVFLSAIVVLYVGCNSAVNNNNGASFTNLGFFQSLPESNDDTLPTAETVKFAPISTSNPETGGTSTQGAITSVIGLQNNMDQMFIRTTKVILQYFIAGAVVNPPSTELPLNIVLGPAVKSSSGTSSDSSSSSTSTGFKSSLPDSFGDGSIPNRRFVSITAVPVEVMAWLNLNRDSLPELPFTMSVTAEVVGITSAGDTIVSNQAVLFVQVNPDNIISPTDGSSSSDSSTDNSSDTSGSTSTSG